MRMNKLFVFIVFFGTAQLAAAQSRGIGIRLGEPTGVTYKNYFARGRAFELGIGTAATGWNSNYYESSFRKRNGAYNYTSHQVDNIVYLQGRYLLNYEVPVRDVEGRFDWYWGVGAVLKAAQVHYYYTDDTPPYTFSESRTDIDFGPEGILGAEYKFEDLPITLFAEVSLMMEFADRFGAFRGFIGTGARYQF